MHRFAVPLAAAAVFAALAVLHVRDAALYETLLAAWAVPIGEIPFIDWHAVLSAIQCHRLGEDVYAVNSCDLIGRKHAYSPLWLALPIPADTASTMAWGLAWTVAFFLTLAALPLPKGRGAAIVMLVAVLSPSVVLAVERANNDMAIMVASVAAGWLFSRGMAARVVAYGILIFAATLKYYPALALALALRERPRLFLAITAASLAAAMALVAGFWERWEGAARLLRLNLRFGLYTVSLRNPIEYNALTYPGLHDQPLHGLLLVALLAGFALLTAVLHGRLRRHGLALDLTRTDHALLAVSGLLMAGCFLSGSSLPYRAVLLLPAFPALLSWAADHPQRAARRLAAGLIAVLLYLLWLPLLHQTTAAAGLPVLAALLIPFKEIGWWLACGVFVALVIPVAMRPYTKSH